MCACLLNNHYDPQSTVRSALVLTFSNVFKDSSLQNAKAASMLLYDEEGINTKNILIV